MKQGWEIKKLGEVCEISTGKSNTEDAIENGDFAFFDRSKFVKRSSKFLFDCDAIIVAGEGQTFLPKFYSGKFDLHQRAYAIYNFDKSVSVHYAYKYLIHFHKYFESVAVGATAKSLRLRHFQDLPIPIPPIKEQRRIVSILDECFAAIAKAKANAEQNLKNAKELFESYLKTAFENKVHGERFEPLDSLCELIVDCEHKTAPTQETGYPSIRTPNIGKGELILENVNRVSYETYLQWTRRAVPKSDDLILAREAPAGNIAVIPENIEVCLGQRTVLLRPKKDRLVSKYLAYLILSKEVQEILLSHSTGATVQHINMKDIRAFKIYDLSDLKEQKAVVQKLDALRAETQKLEAIYQKKLDDLEELKKSILQKAFAGELKVSEPLIITD